jgi:hypothetical protein
VTRIFSPGIRRWLEYLSLTHAFALAGVLIVLHLHFVNPNLHCLSEYFKRQGIDPYRPEVLQLRIVSRRFAGAAPAQCSPYDGEQRPFCDQGACKEYQHEAYGVGVCTHSSASRLL